MIKLAIVGSRSFNDYSSVVYYFEKFRHDINILETSLLKKEILIVSGGAKGADRLAEQLSLDKELEFLEIKARWDIYGRKAGFKRNRLIVEVCDYLIAFWDGESRGTSHSIKLAKEQNKLYKIVRF